MRKVWGFDEEGVQKAEINVTKSFLNKSSKSSLFSQNLRSMVIAVI